MADAVARRRAGWVGSTIATTHALQRRLVDDRVAGAIGDQLLLLEHPAVLTLGKHADPGHILASEDVLAGARHRRRADRTRRRGHLPRPGSAGRLSDRRPARARPAPATVRASARGRPGRDVRRARGRRGATRRPPRLLGRPGRAGAAQDRRPRPARRARRQLPRDRPERHGRPPRLRAHRRVRHARRRLDLDRPRAGRRSAHRPRPRSSAPAPIFARGLRRRHRRPARDRRTEAAMASGLFELRKDPITGWWVATIVDRAFHRDRFARAAEPVDDRTVRLRQLLEPAGRRRPDPDAQGLRVPRRRHRRRRARARPRPRHRPGLDRAGACDRLVAHGRRAAQRAPPAPRRGHGRHRGPRRRRPGRARRGQGPRPDRVPRRRPELGRPGRRADEPPLLRPVRPARRSRTASPRSSAARRVS